MRDVARLLRDGLRLALLLAPRAIPLRVGAAHWLVLVALGVLLDVATQWTLFDAPRTLNGYGVQSACTAALLRLGAAALLCAFARRSALLWPAAAWLEVASWLPALLVQELVRVGASDPIATMIVSWSVLGAWTLAISVRLALFLDPHPARAIGGALLASMVTLAPWWVLEAQPVWRPDWEAMREQQQESWSEPGTIGAAEDTFYAQPRRLRAALQALAPQRPDHVDLYALAFGGDASEDVFRNEVEYVERLFAQRFDAQGRTLTLLNHPATAATRPLATATNLERALRGVGERIDREQDIVFVYLTSHGSQQHELYVNQPPLPLDPMTPQRLRGALDAAGIRWRVIVVSACYSGGFIDALRDEHTLVLTAARADRTSFGCGADSEITWFGKAFLAEALNETADFVAAFAQARASIAAWERDNPDVEASDPQLDAGAKIAAQLAAWRAGFTPGAAVQFEASADAKSDAP